MNRPFVWTALAYIIGILTADYLSIPSFFAWLGAGGFLALAGLCLFFRWEQYTACSNIHSNIFSIIPILLAIFSLGILSYQQHVRIPPDNISNFLKENKTEVILSGVVVKDPDKELCPDGRTRMTLTLDLKRARFDDVLWRRVSGRVLVYVYGVDSLAGQTDADMEVTDGEYPYRYGDSLILKAQARLPRGPSNPGQFDYREYLKRQGINAVAGVNDTRDIILVERGAWDEIFGFAGGGQGTTLRCKDSGWGRVCGWSYNRVIGPVLGGIYGLKHKMGDIIDQSFLSLLSGKQRNDYEQGISKKRGKNDYGLGTGKREGGTKSPEAELLKAMLLGDREGIPEEMKDSFIKTGTVHILAISGLHTGLVAFAILIFLKLLRLPRRMRYGLAIILLIGFAFMTGLNPPVLRATITAGLIMGAVLLNREIDIYNCLGLAALLILAVNPYIFFDAGFQLSFVAVISIVYLCPRFEQMVFGKVFAWIEDKSSRNINPVNLKFVRYLIKLFSTSVSAWIGTMPLIWYYFNIISPIAILVNMVIVPLLFPAVACGLCMLLTGLIWFNLTDWFWAGVSWLWLKLMVVLSSFFSQIKFGYFYWAKPSIFFMFVYYILLVLAVQKKRGDNLPVINRPGNGFCYGAAALIIVNLAIWPPLIKNMTAPSGKMKVVFLDVGHGDSTYIKFPNGGNMLIDTGMGPPGDMGRWVIQPFLLREGVRRLDTLILTHYDYDHCGGTGILLDNFGSVHIFDNGTASQMLKGGNKIDEYNYQKIIDSAGHNIIGLRQDIAISGYPGPVKIEVLSPRQEGTTDVISDGNNNSVVLKITYNRISFLFCGDIEEKSMAGLLALGRNLRADVLKVPHHGGKVGLAGKLFLEQVRPKIAIISEAEENRFGLPNKVTIDALQELGVRILQTGRHGAITITTDGNYMYADTFLQATQNF